MIDYQFSVGKYPVTFAEYDRHAAAFRKHVENVGHAEGFPGLDDEWWPNTSGDQGWGRGNRPVINVSWYNAKSYAHWLSVMTGKAYRLLTEAEWEYACRAGTETAYAFGETLSHSEAHFSERSRYRVAADRTIEIGTFPPNAFGLYDMHGNVWEWCEDYWADSYAGAPDDGSPRNAPRDYDVSRVLRGGSWRCAASQLASGYRREEQQGTWSDDIGFRLALSTEVPARN